MKMLNLLPLLILTGCCTVETVYVPVPTCDQPPPFTAPALMVDSLPADASTKQKLEAIRLDYGALQGSLEQCIILLDGYRK